MVVCYGASCSHLPRFTLKPSIFSRIYVTHLSPVIEQFVRDLLIDDLYTEFTEACHTATLLSRYYSRLAGQVQWKPGPLFAVAVSGNVRSHYLTLFSSSCSHSLFSQNSPPLPPFLLFSSLTHQLYATLACWGNT